MGSSSDDPTTRVFRQRRSVPPSVHAIRGFRQHPAVASTTLAHRQRLTVPPSSHAIRGLRQHPAVVPTIDAQRDSSADPPSAHGSQWRWIVIGVGGGALLVAVAIVFYVCRKRRQGRQRPPPDAAVTARPQPPPDLKGINPQTFSFTLKEIADATNNFAAENKIGEGGFGSVYKGNLSDGTIIAVKQLSPLSKQGGLEFIAEIGFLSTLQHSNLVKLYGCCTEGNQKLLVYEYVANNSLARCLFGPDFSIELDWTKRYTICIGVARALSYLHEGYSLKIVHRDIKAANVLLDKDLHPKISDFGLAKLFEERKHHTTNRVVGTFGYMPPEYALKGHVSEKIDVYSFGVLCLEIISGRRCRDYVEDVADTCLLDWAQMLHAKGDLMKLADKRLGPTFKKKQLLKIVEIALSCTHQNPWRRPSMTAVVGKLAGDVA